MSKAIIEDIARWYVVHTHPKQEDRAAKNLSCLGALIFSPKIKERRYNQFVSAPTYLTKPLFPRYIFAQFKVNDLYHKVRFTRGVYNMVSFGECPTSIDEEVITLIQSRVSEDGFVRIGEDLRIGDKVKVKDGPLRNFAGVFERELKDSDRIRILLETVSYQAHIEVEKDLVVRV